VVGFGDRAAVGLLRCREPAAAHGKDDLPSLAGEVGGEGEQSNLVHHPFM